MYEQDPGSSEIHVHVLGRSPRRLEMRDIDVSRLNRRRDPGQTSPPAAAVARDGGIPAPDLHIR